MREDIASRAAEIHRFIDAAWPLSTLEEPAVRRWRSAARAILLALLGYAGLQYYFFDVYLTIMALPRVGVIAGLP